MLPDVILTLLKGGKAASFYAGLSDGVMVTQRPLEALFMVRIHVGQPLFPMKMQVARSLAQNLHKENQEILTSE